jgi:hypothetical protein
MARPPRRALECRKQANSLSVNAAMHKTHCCYATSSLQSQVGRAYFRIINKIEKIEIRRKARNEHENEPDPQLPQLAPLPRDRE